MGTLLVFAFAQPASATSPTRPPDTGLLAKLPNGETPEDAIDRFTKLADEALARGDKASFEFHRDAAYAVTIWVILRQRRGLPGFWAYPDLINMKWEKPDPADPKQAVVESGVRILKDWLKYLDEIQNWEAAPAAPAATPQSPPAETPKPRQAMSVPARPVGQFLPALSIPASFTPIAGHISGDAQEFCSYGKATPLPVAFVPADAAGNPLETKLEDELLAAIAAALARSGPPAPIDIRDPDEPRKPAFPPGTIPPQQVQIGDDGDNKMVGTRGRDDISGKGGTDTFEFQHATPTDQTKVATLDDGDRIRDYEFGEVIRIQGITIPRPQIKIVYDGQKNETRIELDLSHANVPNKTIYLDGDKRGRFIVNPPCCVEKQTEIIIQAPADDGQAAGVQPPAPQPGSAPQPDAAPQPGAVPQSGSGQSAPPATEKAETGDKPATPPSPPSDAAMPGPAGSELVVTIHFKVTDAALQEGAQAPVYLQAKLTIPEPALPKPGRTRTAKDDAGHDKAPVTCVAGSDGCKAKLTGKEMKDFQALYRELLKQPAATSAAGSGVAASDVADSADDFVPAENYRVDLAMAKTTGAVIRKAEALFTPAQLAVLKEAPKGVEIVKSPFKAGDRIFTRVGFAGPDALTAKVIEKLREVFGPDVRIDLCIDKQPGPPLGMTPVSLSALNSELPEATLGIVPNPRTPRTVARR